MIESGYESVTGRGRDWRWWVYVDEDIETVIRALGVARGQTRPPTPGRFRFARGGLAASVVGARVQIRRATMIELAKEARAYAYRPTHALGERGELIPLDAAAPEITA